MTQQQQNAADTVQSLGVSSAGVVHHGSAGHCTPTRHRQMTDSAPLSVSEHCVSLTSAHTTTALSQLAHSLSAS